MTDGFFNWRSCQPGSNQITSLDQYQWLAAWPSHRGRCLCLIREGDGDNYCFLHEATVERAGDSLSGIDCLGQPISPVPQQKTWEARMPWLVEQSGTPHTPPVAGNLSRVGYYSGMVRAAFLVQARVMWPNTFRLDCSVLGQTAGLVKGSKSWKCYVRPMKQTVPDTCAIIACIVAVEGMHRKVYEASHSEGTFVWKAAERWPEILRATCQTLPLHIWKKGKGANTGNVLAEIQRLGGVGIASYEEPLRMPLRSWEPHLCDGLTPELVAGLLDQGPCVGTLWVCPWYYWFNAANNDDWVYRGCGRDKRLRDESTKLYSNKATGSHALVCIGYRFCETGNGEKTMHVLVMDNHDNKGPQRWIDVEELDAIYTLSVDCLA